MVNPHGKGMRTLLAAARWTTALLSWPVLIVLPPLISAIVGLPWAVLMTLAITTMPFASLGAWWISGVPFTGAPDCPPVIPAQGGHGHGHRALGLGLLVTLVIGVSFSSSLVIPGADQEATLFLSSIGPWRALLLVVSGAIGEELLCRGLLWNMLTEIGLDPTRDPDRFHVRDWSRTLIAAGVFALMHMDVQHSLAVFPLGVLFGVARSRYGLWAAILAHVVNNVGAWLFMLA